LEKTQTELLRQIQAEASSINGPEAVPLALHIFTFVKFAPNRRSRLGASRRTKAVFSSFEQRTRPTTSQTARLSGGKWRMYSGSKSILVRVGLQSGLLLPILLFPDIVR